MIHVAGGEGGYGHNDNERSAHCGTRRGCDWSSHASRAELKGHSHCCDNDHVEVFMSRQFFCNKSVTRGMLRAALKSQLEVTRRGSMQQRSLHV